MINVIVVDDHQLFIDGILSILEADKQIQVIGTALNGRHALDLLENSKEIVDVVLLDIEMPELNGIETAKIIIEKYPNIKVLIVSMYKKKNYITQLMNIGVSGYLFKNNSKASLINAINQVKAGHSYFGLDVLTEVTSNPYKGNDTESLTKREIEVLCKIGEGYTTKEIAELLNIGQTTVNTYRRNLLHKLSVPNDKHLVRYAIKKGLAKL